jgi:hypothetical protein
MKIDSKETSDVCYILLGIAVEASNANTIDSVSLNDLLETSIKLFPLIRSQR